MGRKTDNITILIIYLSKHSRLTDGMIAKILCAEINHVKYIRRKYKIPANARSFHKKYSQKNIVG